MIGHGGDHHAGGRRQTSEASGQRAGSGRRELTVDRSRPTVDSQKACQPAERRSFKPAASSDNSGRSFAHSGRRPGEMKSGRASQLRPRGERGGRLDAVAPANRGAGGPRWSSLTCGLVFIGRVVRGEAASPSWPEYCGKARRSARCREEGWHPCRA